MTAIMAALLKPTDIASQSQAWAKRVASDLVDLRRSADILALDADNQASQVASSAELLAEQVDAYVQYVAKESGTGLALVEISRQADASRSDQAGPSPSGRSEWPTDVLPSVVVSPPTQVFQVTVGLQGFMSEIFYSCAVYNALTDEAVISPAQVWNGPNQGRGAEQGIASRTFILDLRGLVPVGTPLRFQFIAREQINGQTLFNRFVRVKPLMPAA